jgi:single-strand DNA-binding protein
MPVGLTTLTITGNLTADPELTHLPDGTARCAFTVASNPRTWDANASEWRDGNALFLHCTAWRALGEHVAVSLHKGLRVVVTGALRQYEIDTADGVRSGYALDVDDIGPSLKWATADVHRADRAAKPPTDDPWATNGAAGNRSRTGRSGKPGADTEPPF